MNLQGLVALVRMGLKKFVRQPAYLFLSLLFPAILSYMDKKRRRCMYVPKELVPVIRQAIKNGRRLEKMLHPMGPRLIREYRKKRNRNNNSKL